MAPPCYDARCLLSPDPSGSPGLPADAFPFRNCRSSRVLLLFFHRLHTTVTPGEKAMGDACELFRLYPLSSSTPCSFNVSPRKSRVLPAVPGTCFLPGSVCIMTLFSSTQPLTHGSSDAEQIKNCAKTQTHKQRVLFRQQRKTFTAKLFTLHKCFSHTASVRFPFVCASRCAAVLNTTLRQCEA